MESTEECTRFPPVISNITEYIDALNIVGFTSMGLLCVLDEGIMVSRSEWPSSTEKTAYALLMRILESLNTKV